MGQDYRWSWLWLYRSTAADTVSINLVVGSANSARDGNDDGYLRGVDFTFSDVYTGTPSILEANDPSEITGSAPTFTGTRVWPTHKDDGASIGGIKPIVPEPGTGVLLGLAAVALLAVRGKRRRRADPASAQGTGAAGRDAAIPAKRLSVPVRS